MTLVFHLKINIHVDLKNFSGVSVWVRANFSGVLLKTVITGIIEILTFGDNNA